MTTTPLGWYPDPQNPATVRWFDGTQWTEHVAAAGSPGPHPAPPTSRSTTTTVLIVVASCVGVFILLGILAAIALPVALNQSKKQEFATSVQSVTCEQVVDEAVELSHENLPEGYVGLAGVSDVVAVTDDRADVQRPRSGELVHVLTCEGTARWDDGRTDTIRLSLSVDSAGRHTIADTTQTTT